MGSILKTPVATCFLKFELWVFLYITNTKLFLTTTHKKYVRLCTHSTTILSCSVVYKCGSFPPFLQHQCYKHKCAHAQNMNANTWLPLLHMLLVMTSADSGILNPHFALTVVNVHHQMVNKCSTEMHTSNIQWPSSTEIFLWPICLMYLLLMAI